MDIAEALDVNPAWLQFGEPYARKAWLAEASKKPRLTERPEFTAWLKLADRLVEAATKNQLKNQLSETARLLALNLAHYQIPFGEITA
jgi:hypothetical protein